MAQWWTAVSIISEAEKILSQQATLATTPETQSLNLSPLLDSLEEDFLSLIEKKPDEDVRTEPLTTKENEINTNRYCAFVSFNS